MAQRPSSFWRLLSHVPKLILLSSVGLFVIIIARILAIFGHPKVWNDIKATFRRWHILPAITDEEKLERRIFYVTWRRQFLGLRWYEVFFYSMRKAFGEKRPMGYFLEEKFEKVKTAFPNSMQRLAKLDDLGLVIGATSLVDELLGLVIVIRFHVLITKRNWERVFEGDGPLGRFSAKISMGIVLGLVLGDMAHDLAILKKIRNDFAHALTPQSLSEIPHTSRCKSLKLKTDLSPEIIADCGTEERRRFLESVAAIILYLVVVLQRGIIEKIHLAKHSAEINEELNSRMKKLGKGEIVTEDAASTSPEKSP